MVTLGIPLEVRKFIYETIETVGHLEVLCTFLSAPGKKWNANSLQKELRSHVTIAGKQLEHLKSKGLIKDEGDGQYGFGPDDSIKEKLSHELFDLYKKSPVSIISLIYDKPTDSLKVFADAFKMKKD